MDAAEWVRALVGALVAVSAVAVAGWIMYASALHDLRRCEDELDVTLWTLREDRAYVEGLIGGRTGPVRPQRRYTRAEAPPPD